MTTSAAPMNGHSLLEAGSESLVTEALKNADDGELFAEASEAFALRFDDNVLKDASHHHTQGMGLRAVHGACCLYAHTPDLSRAGLQRITQTLAQLPVDAGQSTKAAGATPGAVTQSPPIHTVSRPFQDKVRALEAMNTFARGLDARVVQVSLSLSSSHQDIQIIRPDATVCGDTRRYTTFVVVVTVDAKGRREFGHVSLGRRLEDETYFLDDTVWQPAIREALRKALVNLRAVPAPGGTLPVVLGKGITGILLHEAVGHGFEADFNRKGHSVFSTKMGKEVASPLVTVIDEGRWDMALAHGHGCLSIDDEGTPTQRTTLIEKGRMTGHMSDRLNARLMGKASSGNGRRQSYAHLPMPRMTNTYMMPGDSSFDDMIGGVEKGVYAVGFNGGQVDIVSGNFVFSTSEAYEIVGGKLGQPLKGATLIGNGPEVMKQVKAVGSDLVLDPGVGYCGKNGQTVIVGLGQPSCLVDGMTVGGTQIS